MKAVALIKNHQERLALKPMLKDCEVLEFPKSTDEFNEKMRSNDRFDIVILDERTGGVDLAIEYISVNYQDPPPIILVIVSERGSQSTEVWKEEYEKMEHYANMGVELYIHRPFGLADLKFKIENAVEWMQSLPAWVKLVRVSRQFLKAQQGEKVIPALKVLYGKMPKDLNIGMLYVKALRSVSAPKYDEIFEILATLEKDNPMAYPLLKSKMELSLLTNRTVETAETLVKMCLLQPSEENIACLTDILNRHFIDKEKSFSFWKQLFVPVQSSHIAVLDPVKCLLVQQMAKTAQSLEEFQFYITSFETLEGSKLAATELSLELIVRMKARFKDNLYDQKKVSTLKAKLLEMILDCEPSNARALKKFLDYCFRQKSHSEAEQRLRKIRLTGNLNFQYYLGMYMLSAVKSDRDQMRNYLVEAKKVAKLEEEATELISMETQFKNQANPADKKVA